MNKVNNGADKLNRGIIKIGAPVIVAGFCAFLFGCDTLEGLGSDIESAGETLKETAKKAKGDGER